MFDCNLVFARLAADFLKVDYLFLAVGVVGGACSDVQQNIIQVDQYSKREHLLDLLKTTGAKSVFAHLNFFKIYWSHCSS